MTRYPSASWRKPSAPVRLITLLVLAVGLMLVDLAALGVFFGVVALLFLLECGRTAIKEWLRALWQLKWLFLALAVLYLGFTPGTPLLDWAARPTWQGALEGGHRALVLATLLMAVHWLVRPVPTDALAGGMVWLTTPLERLGLHTRRFAVRLAMTLHRVGELQEQVNALRGAARQGWVDTAAELIRGIEQAPSANTASQAIELPTPQLQEWLMPVALAGGVIAGLAL
ncbi:MAG: hypothetical protein KAG72_03470 [Abyssibacter sp.]|nr:hypothetical protein [Abyssibacter sp.]